jgi:hypothetical protein
MGAKFSSETSVHFQRSPWNYIVEAKSLKVLFTVTAKKNSVPTLNTLNKQQRKEDREKYKPG